MKMKKWHFFLTGAAAVTLLVYGFTFFGGNQASATSASSDGSVVSVDPAKQQIVINEQEGQNTYPLSKNVWIYRNEQKAVLADLLPGDKARIVFNSRQQAAYIMASAADYADASTKAEAGTDAAQTVMPGQSPAPTSQPTVTPAPASHSERTNPDSPAAAGTTEADFPDKLEISLIGPEYEIKLKQERNNGKPKAEVKIKQKDTGSIHLKDAQAEQFIRQLLTSIHYRSDMDKDEIAQALAGALHIGTSSKKEIKIETKQSAGKSSANSKNNQEKHESKGKQKDGKHDDDEDDNDNED